MVALLVPTMVGEKALKWESTKAVAKVDSMAAWMGYWWEQSSAVQKDKGMEQQSASVTAWMSVASLGVQLVVWWGHWSARTLAVRKGHRMELRWGATMGMMLAEKSADATGKRWASCSADPSDTAWVQRWVDATVGD